MTTWRDALHPDLATRQHLLRAAVERLHDADVARGRAPIGPPAELAETLRAIDAADFAAAAAPEEALMTLIAQLAHGPGRHLHAMSFGILTPRPSFPPVLADLVVSWLNPQLATWNSGPAANAMERRLVRYVGRRFGYDAGRCDGHFTTGGQEANATAVLTALARRFPEFAAEGVRGCPAAPTFYVSSEAHASWTKIARVVGLGAGGVRRVATDAAGRLRVDDLRAAVARDRADGHAPFLAVATAGTTTAGAVDDLHAVGTLCRAEDLAFHVDAAWGGALAFSPSARAALDGVAGADSVTFDPHKWLAMPLGCGMFLARDGGVLDGIFESSADYFTHADGDVDLCFRSLQWSRRAVGVKLYLTLQILGADGLAALVDDALARGEVLRAAIRGDGWRVENDTVLPVVCFSDPRCAPATVAHELVERGLAFVTAPSLSGRPVLRASILNLQTREQEIDRLIAGLREVRARTSDG